MSEPPSLRGMEQMEQMNAELDETPSLCPKEGPFQRLGTQFMSAISRFSAGSRDAAPSHRGDPVVPSTMPGTFPDSEQSHHTNHQSRQLERVEGRSVLHGGSGRPQGGDGEGERFDDFEGNDDLADDCSPPWLEPKTSWSLSSCNAAHFCRKYGDCLRSDSTSYPQTEGTELPNEIQSKH